MEKDLEKKEPESLCCTPETKTTLEINSVSMKKVKKKERKKERKKGRKKGRKEGMNEGAFPSWRSG